MSPPSQAPAWERQFSGEAPLRSVQNDKLKITSLSATWYKRIQSCIDELAEDPVNPRISDFLVMGKNRHYSRVGNWRIIFEVWEGENIIYVSAIQPRDKVYKHL
ncbi:MAG: hypothetical protein FJ126_07265 [Deltaproteobacteria bacterium]|nr:hypothetical protein [Deltaproteobacteria bacterium]